MRPFQTLTLPSQEKMIEWRSANPYLQAATSSNTRKAYQQDIRHFISWGGLLPTTADQLLQYLAFYASSLNPRTLRRRLTAIKHWHIYQGFSDPTGHPLVRKTLSGILRLHGKPLEKAAPLCIEHMMLFSQYLVRRGTLVDCRNNALILIGFFGAFRRSELVSILWENIRFVPEGLIIMLSRSKTDQEGEGQICPIPFGNQMLCPVTALRQWQERGKISSGPVFRAIHKNGVIKQHALSAVSVNLILKNLAQSCQLLNHQAYSGHSLRRGFATSASKKGATLGAIMRQGRWRHEGTVYGYIEEGRHFEDNAANAILNNLISEQSEYR